MNFRFPKGRRQRKEVKKEDISAPFGFEHVEHNIPLSFAEAGYQTKVQDSENPSRDKATQSEETLTIPVQSILSDAGSRSASSSGSGNTYIQEIREEHVEEIRNIVRDEIKEALKPIEERIEQILNMQRGLQINGTQGHVLDYDCSAKNTDSEHTYVNISTRRSHDFVRSTGIDIPDESLDVFENHLAMPNVIMETVEEETEPLNRPPMPSQRVISTPARQNRIFSRSSTLSSTDESGPRGMDYKRKVNQVAVDDERECLAQAVQAHVEKIVDVLEYRDSDLPDILTRDGHTTETESQTIRSLPGRKCQVRALLSLIKGRDKRVLEAFLLYMKEHHSDIANSIGERYRKNKEDKVYCNVCIACKIKKNIDVSYVIDGLWAKQVIDDSIYRECIWTKDPASANDNLWDKLFTAINNKPHTWKNLIQLLKGKNHYVYLGNVLEKRLNMGNRIIGCSCHLSWSWFSQDSSKSATSYYPRSSCSTSFDSDTKNHNGVSTSLQENTARKEQFDDEVSHVEIQRPKDKPPPLPYRRESKKDILESSSSNQ